MSTHSTKEVCTIKVKVHVKGIYLLETFTFRHVTQSQMHRYLKVSRFELM